MFEGFLAKVIPVGEITISCLIGGEGAPVLLLHGFPQNKSLWARVAPLLAKNFTVICADLRGYGDSSKPECAPDASNYSFRPMAQDQKQVMKALGFDAFHVVGHDRGARTALRMAKDYPGAVRSLTAMDVVPTYDMLTNMNLQLSQTYWHWRLLAQPTPFPERIIAQNPDYFYEACLLGWGGATLEDFDPELLADYRRSWRNRGMIHGSCSDYRAAIGIDFEHDKTDLDVPLTCPVLVY